jgi:hypothetical protein
MTVLPAAAPSLPDGHPPIDKALVRRMHERLTEAHRRYLRERRRLSDEVINRYQLGFTDRWGDRRLAIPIEDDRGVVVNVRCWLPERYRTDTSTKILPWARGYGTPARLFPLDQLEHDEIALPAGEMDALSLISHGIPAITATCGEGTWPDELSRHFEGKTVAIIPDNDDTGHRSAEMRAESIRRAGSMVKIAGWPR